MMSYFPYSDKGFRSWYSVASPIKKTEMQIFIVDFETYEKSSKLNSGIVIYFITNTGIRQQAFMEYEHYFYLKLKPTIDYTTWEGKHCLEKARSAVFAIGQAKKKNVIKRVEICHLFDSDDLLFLERNLFLKVVLETPSCITKIRNKLEEISEVVEWREADIQFHHRIAIDNRIGIGKWYDVVIDKGLILDLQLLEDRLDIPILKLLTFDIETHSPIMGTPNPTIDQISMIVISTGEKTIVQINTSVVKSEDLEEIMILMRDKDKNHDHQWIDWQIVSTFNSEPKSYKKAIPVKIQQFETEITMLNEFIQVLEKEKPDIIGNFFGIRFDLPFIAGRFEYYALDFMKITGLTFKWKFGTGTSKDYMKDVDTVVCVGPFLLDAYLWNEKYSYLPEKDLGLKTSVEKKLKIIPIGREALFAIEENPAEAVGYAACDGYLIWCYIKQIILDFCISIGRIFPIPSSELLTLRAGFLDDLLIDAENHKYNIVGKRRVEQRHIESFSPRILIDSFTHTGGLVEARCLGIFRSDIQSEFVVDKKALSEIKDVVQEIIVKYTKSTVKNEINAELGRKLLEEFSDLSIIYTEDLDQLIQAFKAIMKQNGISQSVLEEKNALFRKILEGISQIRVEGVDQVIQDTLGQIDDLIQTSNSIQMRGVHVDVTSMYPSQIRQYKLQPSAIVPLSKCQTCEYAENDGSCYFEGDWIIKLTAHRPCRHRKVGSSKCDPSICTTENESSCSNYEPEQSLTGRVQEVYAFNKGNTNAYALRKKSGLVKIAMNKSYLGRELRSIDLLEQIKAWLKDLVEATQITCRLNKNYFDVFEDQPDDFQVPENTFLSLDVRTKKITVLLSVYSRVCQKSFNFVTRIMDDFFNTRVKHKFEAQRLKEIIQQNTSNNPLVSYKLYQQQKFHDSTQLGMKVPLNSIYGLFGMKAGVRNASTPCAGITTKLSADLIRWAADQLEKIGTVTELDSDGIWVWVPRQFPLDFPVNLVNPSNPNTSREIRVSLLIKS